MGWGFKISKNLKLRNKINVAKKVPSSHSELEKSYKSKSGRNKKEVHKPEISSTTIDF